MRLHLNGADVERRYHALLRDHVEGNAGLLPPQRDGKDVGAGPRTDRPDRLPASLRI
jgi:hypothetical protein